MQSGLQEECWRSAERWCTLISVAIRSAMLGQKVLQECWRSAERWLTSISASMALNAVMTSDQTEQRALQECWGSAQRWLTSSSAPMESKLSGKGGFERRGVVKPLDFLYRHVALLARCHLFSRQTTRKSDILYTYSVVAFGLALSL